MKNIALICTGTELLKGSTVNTNAAFLGRLLTEKGIPLSCAFTAGDAPQEIAAALSCAVKNADILLISGGLGPTKDDCTREIVARFFGRELLLSAELENKVHSFWEMRHPGMHCPKIQLKQAMLPEGAEILPNPVGSAAGSVFKTLYAGKERLIFLLPGPPRELEPMAQHELLPRLLALNETPLYTSGFFVHLGETAVAAKVEELLAPYSVGIAYTAKPGGTRLFLSSADEKQLFEALETARQALGADALPVGELDPCAYLLKLCRTKHLTLGCAESCTGGKVADLIVTLPGASESFLGGIVSYANSVKESVLGVPAETLAKVGAVSEETARAMAQGACRALNCDLAVSTTGVAGPGGGTPEKPVGLVWIGASFRGRTEARELHLRGDRAIIRERAAAAAVKMLLDLLRDEGVSAC